MIRMQIARVKLRHQLQACPRVSLKDVFGSGSVRLHENTWCIGKERLEEGQSTQGKFRRIFSIIFTTQNS